jgi:uncharacterized protein YciI
MKTRITALFFLCLSLSTSISLAEPKQENKLVQFHMAIIRKGPNWSGEQTDETRKIREQHVGYVVSLLSSGKVVAAGPFSDDAGILGILILRAANAEEAKSLADADPAVKAGHHMNEMHPWWSEEVFGKMAMPMKLETVYFGFLKRGPNRKEGDGKTPEVQELQKAHIANINRLAETKKLVVAGPFGDDGELRGIFVFRVGSLKEAEALAATDPMIKIDRLRLEVHPWNVPNGIIP